MPAIPYVKNPLWQDGAGGGTSIDAADLNKIENGIFEISYAPAVRVTHNVQQLVASATPTALAFNSERFDQAGNAADTMHDTITNNSRLTCRYAGIYMIAANAVWSGNPATGDIRIRLNNTTDIASSGIQANYLHMHVSTLHSLAVNDFVQVRVTQTSGISLNIASLSNLSPEFMMVRVA